MQYSLIGTEWEGDIDKGVQVWGGREKGSEAWKLFALLYNFVA